MTLRSSITRRQFLGRTVVGLAVVAAAGTAACGGSDGPECANPPGLTPAQQTQRTALEYKDRSPDPAKRCQGCALFTAAASADACGGCQLNMGAVSPLGTCKSFSPRA